MAHSTIAKRAKAATKPIPAVSSDKKPIILFDEQMAINVLELLQELYCGQADLRDQFSDNAEAGMYFLLGAVVDVLGRKSEVARA